MRQALTLALRHTTTRKAFGTSIAERPMMANVLADMAVEVEAATLMALRVAKATDLMKSDGHERRSGMTGAWGSMFGTPGLTINKAAAVRIVDRANVAR